MTPVYSLFSHIRKMKTLQTNEHFAPKMVKLF